MLETKMVMEMELEIMATIMDISMATATQEVIMVSKLLQSSK